MALLLYFLLFIPLALRTINLAFHSQMIDFSYYLQSVSDLFHVINPYTTNLLYPPASLYLFIPFSLTGFAVSKIIWTCLSLLAFFFGIYILVRELVQPSFHDMSRHCGLCTQSAVTKPVTVLAKAGLTVDTAISHQTIPDLIGRFSAELSAEKTFGNLYKSLYKLTPINLSLVIFLFFMQTFPVKFALAQGQINFFVFFGFSQLLYFLDKNKDFSAGLTLAVITSLKFNPLFFALYFLILLKTKATLSFIITYLILNLSIDFFYHFQLNISFIQSVVNMANHYSTYYYNQSLAAWFGRLISDQFWLKASVNFVSLLLWGLTSFSLFRSHNHTTKNFLIFIVTVLITSPLTWQHHLIFTIPIFIYLIIQIKITKSYLLGILTFLSFVLINLNLKSPQFLSYQNPLYSHATFGLLLLYFNIYFLSTAVD